MKIDHNIFLNAINTKNVKRSFQLNITEQYIMPLLFFLWCDESIAVIICLIQGQDHVISVMVKVKFDQNGLNHCIFGSCWPM